MLASQPTEALQQPRFPAAQAQPDDALDGLLDVARGGHIEGSTPVQPAEGD